MEKNHLYLFAWAYYSYIFCYLFSRSDLCDIQNVDRIELISGIVFVDRNKLCKVLNINVCSFVCKYPLSVLVELCLLFVVVCVESLFDELVVVGIVKVNKVLGRIGYESFKMVSLLERMVKSVSSQGYVTLHFHNNFPFSFWR